MLSGCRTFRCANRLTTTPSLSPKPLPTARIRPQIPLIISLQHIRHVSKAADKPDTSSGNTYTQPHANLDHEITPAEEHVYASAVAASKEKQARAPWLREGSDRPPVDRIGNNKSYAKGKLLTTPSRMLKLIIPLASRDELKDDRKDKELEPLALLVHPSQPLSYLERLIQSELPSIKEGEKERIPGVWFRAPDAADEEEGSDDGGKGRFEKKDEDLDEGDVTIIEGKRVQTGKLKGDDKEKTKKPKKTTVAEEEARERERELEVDENDPTAGFVRWSGSTEIGDFIRDAARAKNFALDIEGNPNSILVGVPSFSDRTYYLRMRLRQKSMEIVRLADIKHECDQIAHKGAKRVAVGGGGALVVYWFAVYVLTFRTELGWDVMEPVTYLVGLTTIIGGYAWFLVNNRQVSYRSAMNITISRRQSKLYEQKGFDLARWEELMGEGNRLRREIKMIAEEYDVTWNEKDDAKSEKVVKALEEERKRKKEAKKDEDEDSD
ncbi:hypothetical protein BT63DRAFT_435242 [Microthyrium microscopicum]|uniref:Calcium uniporter protein n=1 Tax=Microthyrium microscopicum TaxID=703497 RepID=A0A6A6UP99_9PEZI|nr:hypothetical protein BT63DRAFT_435242 [Microthyrium microscopicum]